LPSESGSRTEELLHTINHVVMVYEVAPVGCRDAMFHAFEETRSSFQHAGDGFLNYLRGIFTFERGELFEAGFRVRSEMDFHSKFKNCTNHDFVGKCGRRKNSPDRLGSTASVRI
jgi:hypothetical protein